MDIQAHNVEALKQLIQEYNARISSIDVRLRALETSVQQMRAELEQGRNSANLERARSFTLPDRVSAIEQELIVLRSAADGD